MEVLELLVVRIVDWPADAAIWEQIGYQQERLVSYVAGSESSTRREGQRIRRFLLSLGPEWVPQEAEGAGRRGIQKELIWTADGGDTVRSIINLSFGRWKAHTCPRGGAVDRWQRRRNIRAFFHWCVEQWRIAMILGCGKTRNATVPDSASPDRIQCVAKLLSGIQAISHLLAARLAAKTGGDPKGNSEPLFVIWEALLGEEYPDEPVDHERLLLKEDAAVEFLDRMIYRGRGEGKRQLENTRWRGESDVEGTDAGLTPHEEGLRSLADAIGSTPGAVKKAIQRGRKKAQEDRNQAE
ncbi:MAG: hypothetical protein VCF24_23970 [Candidatus Latescibacterota bacterium]